MTDEVPEVRRNGVGLGGFPYDEFKTIGERTLRAVIWDCCTAHLIEGLTGFAESKDKRDIELRSKQRHKRLAYLSELRAVRGQQRNE